MLNMRQKSNWLFGQIIILGAMIALLVIGLFYKIYNFALVTLGQWAISQAQSACGCAVTPSTSYTMLAGLTLLLAGAIILSLIVTLTKIVRSIIKTRTFLKTQGIHFVKNSPKLAQVATIIGIESRVVEINTSQPLIFCHGLSNEKIYISTAIVKNLSFPELQAALLHETHHLLSKEPARLLFIKLIGAFNFIPGIKNLTKKYLSFAEIAADELATDNFKEKNHLASAMAKILELEEKNVIQKELALSFFSQITEERVLTLSEENYKPTFKTELIKTITGIAVTAIIFFLFGSKLSSQQANAQELYINSGCANKIEVEACKNGWTKCADQIFHQEKIKCEKVLNYFGAK